MGEVRTVRMGPAASAAIPRVWREIRSRGMSQNELARRVGTTSSVVCRWLHGDQRPSRRMAERLETVLDVEPALWDRPLPKSFELRRTA